MDILISSNLERLLYDLSDCETVNNLMSDLKTKGVYKVPTSIKNDISELFYADFCDDEETLETIKNTFNDKNYLMDTHTAVGYAVYKSYVEKTGDKTKTVIASTASPFKFNNSVHKAITGSVSDKGEFELLAEVSDLSGLKIPDSLSELQNKEIRFDKSVSKDGMYGVVSEFLGI